jgi:putative peptidoglycan lipid II flippase
VNLVLRGTVITTAAVGLGTLLGLVRDLLMAGFFGANGGTDAYLVAWTLPETAVPLLVDGAMTLLMIPIFSRALQRRNQLEGDGDSRAVDPVRAAVAATLPRLCAALVLVAALVAATAPWLVRILAPGLADPGLGVAAMRIIAVSVVFVGIAGYFVAALRSHLVYGPPALVTVAMNVGIVGFMLMWHRQLGVLSAVLGAVVGSALMVAVQLPAFIRRVGLPTRLIRGTGVGIGTVLPIAAYILSRQAQVYVERFVASWFAPGTITHLNYVQKIAQVPYSMALILAVVTFPQIARSIAAGQVDTARRRATTDVRIIGAIVLAATVYLFAFAPQVVELVLQRGAFTAADTAATAALLRIYVWGLLGQAVLEIMCRSLFSERATAVPAVSMVLGLLVTAVVATTGASAWGASAIAAANAIGITVAAVAVVVCGRRSSIISARTVAMSITRLLPATGLAAVFALWLAGRLSGLPAAAAVILGGIFVTVVFGLSAVATTGLPCPRGLFAQRGSRAVSVVDERVEQPVNDGTRPRTVLPLRSPIADQPRTTEDGPHPVPWVLMYHSVAENRADPLHITVTPARFERQMRWLRDRGLRGVTLTEALRAAERGDRQVVGLTFDDGYADFVTTAVPILRRFDFAATVYVLAGRLGGSNEWDRPPRKPLMTAEQVRGAAAAGMEIGSHGLTHVSLPTVGRCELTAELEHSKTVLSGLVDRPVVGFAYPYGDLGERELEAVHAAGYQHGCGVGRGVPGSRYALPRTFVGESDTSIRMLARKIRHERLWRRSW